MVEPRKDQDVTAEEYRRTPDPEIRPPSVEEADRDVNLTGGTDNTTHLGDDDSEKPLPPNVSPAADPGAFK